MIQAVIFQCQDDTVRPFHGHNPVNILRQQIFDFLTLPLHSLKLLFNRDRFTSIFLLNGGLQPRFQIIDTRAYSDELDMQLDNQTVKAVNI